MQLNPSDKPIAMKALFTDPDLPPAALRVGLMLIERLNIKTGRCDPGSACLARDLGIAERSVKRATDELVRRGYFQKIRHGGRSHTNRYFVNLPAVRAICAGIDAAAAQREAYPPDARARALGQEGNETGETVTPLSPFPEGENGETVTRLSVNGDTAVTRNGDTAVPQTSKGTSKGTSTHAPTREAIPEPGQGQPPPDSTVNGRSAAVPDPRQKEILYPIPGSKRQWGVPAAQVAENKAIEAIFDTLKKMDLPLQEQMMNDGSVDRAVSAEKRKRGDGVKILLNSRVGYCRMAI